MRLLVRIILSSVIIFLFSFTPIFATSGCCSCHGGVNSCDTSNGRQVCNDGTYSPTCTCAYIAPVVTQKPIVYTPIPTISPTTVPTPSITPTPTASATPTLSPNPTQSPQVEGISTTVPIQAIEPTPTVKPTPIPSVEPKVAGETVGLFSVGFIPFGILAWVIWKKMKMKS